MLAAMSRRLVDGCRVESEDLALLASKASLNLYSVAIPPPKKIEATRPQ